MRGFTLRQEAGEKNEDYGDDLVEAQAFGGRRGDEFAFNKWFVPLVARRKLADVDITVAVKSALERKFPPIPVKMETICGPRFVLDLRRNYVGLGTYPYGRKSHDESGREK